MMLIIITIISRSGLAVCSYHLQLIFNVPPLAMSSASDCIISRAEVLNKLVLWNSQISLSVVAHMMCIWVLQHTDGGHQSRQQVHMFDISLYECISSCSDMEHSKPSSTSSI